jgi:uncharacterized surface protein with fasciclin (FAS1) repeats
MHFVCNDAVLLKKRQAGATTRQSKCKSHPGIPGSERQFETFGSSFVKVTINDVEAAQGLTVFAPVNSAITDYDPNARVYATELSEAEIKDHIVKGIFKRSDLTNGKKLTSLSGKELIIAVENDQIWVNGVLIAAVKEDSGHIVFTINNVLCTKPARPRSPCMMVRNGLQQTP